MAKPILRRSLLDGVDLKKPLHEGYMYKQSHIHFSFNDRYFVLYPRVLVYYETEDEFRRDVARGTLEHRHKAIILDGLWLTKPEKPPNGAKYCIVLHAPHKKNPRNEILLVMRSKQDRKQWMKVLQSQNPKLTSPPTSPSYTGPTSPRFEFPGPAATPAV